MRKFITILYCLHLISIHSYAQPNNKYTYIQADQVFDGKDVHKNWCVVVEKDLIVYVGPIADYKISEKTTIIKLNGKTLLPGLIEGHAHLFLHPYNETSWDDQVLKESRTERTIRAVQHANATLLAGFTTVRDLGTEGAGYDDAGLKRSIEKGLIPGPRMIIASKAIVAKGSYGPKSSNADIDLPQGAAEVGNVQEMAAECRHQISKGADLIKLYADYRWGLDGASAPAFTIEEIKMAVDIAKAGGRQVVAHASTPEGMRRAILGGVSTIEHGDGATPEIYALMKEKGVALCPTLAAGASIEQYRGWKPNTTATPKRILEKQQSFKAALDAGVTIMMGGDVGVFTHGKNSIEMLMMASYGMSNMEVLRSATSVNAACMGLNEKIGSLRVGLKADLIAVSGDPLLNLKTLEQPVFIMKDGIIYSTPLVEGK